MSEVVTATRGRPRSQTARKAVLAAAAELLLDHGLSGVSMDAVAERARVSKATIYRWWPTKETLALDMLFNQWSAVTPQQYESGSLRIDLLALLRAWSRLASGRPYGRVVAALLMEGQTDPAFSAEYQRRIVEPRRDQARAHLRRRHRARRDPGGNEGRGGDRPALRPALPSTAARPRPAR